MSTFLRLLGRPQVEHAGATMPVASERRGQLLVLLALRRGWVDRAELAALFWPQHAASLAATNLRKALHLARALPWAAALELQGKGVRFLVDTDVDRFEHSLREGRSGDALDWCRGELLDGFDDPGNAGWTDWLAVERARHARARQDATHRRLAQLEAMPAERAELARRLLETEPLDEDIVVALLSAQRELGQIEQQRDTYRHFATRLAEELGVEPSLRVQALMRAPSRAPAPAAVPAPLSDGVVGRDSELDELSALLGRPECRLLTIIGSGGLGKSTLLKKGLKRLERELGREALWVPLDDLSEGAQVVARLSAELRITPGPGQNALHLVAEQLAARPVLLMLDNCEHLAELPPIVEQLLERAAPLKVCTTSRVPLASPGEWLLPLHALLAGEAARLFAMAAREHKPDFDAAAQFDGIDALVRAVGGLPLAILLAANWVRLLPVAEIAAELEHSLDVLEVEDDGEERPEHRSVRATFDQSWRLLAPREQRALAALSVLRAPFTRSAAQAVGAASLVLLASLVDKSLVETAASGRFSVHVLVGRLAGEKLGEDAVSHAQACQRHAEYFCRALAAHDPWHAIDQKQAVAAVAAEYADIRVAFGWALAHGRADLVQACTIPLGHFFEQSGRFDEGLALFGQAERMLRGNDRAQQLARATALHVRAILWIRLARFDDGALEAKQAVSLYRSVRDAKGLRDTLTVLSNALTKTGRYAQAQRYCEQGLRAAEEARDDSGVEVFLVNLGMVRFQLGFPEQAVPLYERALAMMRRHTHRTGIIATLNNLGGALIASREPARALPLLEEALRWIDEAGFVAQRSYVLANLAQASLDAGDLAAARRWAEEGLEAVRRGADRSCEALCLMTLGQAAQAEGLREQAQSLLAQAASAATALNVQRYMVRVLLAHAAYCRQHASPELAARLLSCVVDGGVANRIEAGRAAATLAELRAELGDAALAAAAEQARRLTLQAALGQLAHA